MSRRPPRTSYGYIAPSGARLLGWECRNLGCGTGDQPAPHSWPHPCHRCRQPVDPTFEEPWAHEARGYRLRHDLASTDPYLRRHAESEQHVWAYKDARLRDDQARADAAWRSHRRIRQRDGTGSFGITAASGIVRLAAQFDDIDRAVEEILGWYPVIDTRDVDNDNTNRTVARTFVSMCIDVLERESSIDHPREAELDAAMRDIANRAESVLMDHHSRGFQRVGEIRAFHRSRAAIARTRRSLATAYDDMPTISALPPGSRRPPDPTTDIMGVIGLNPWRAMILADDAVETAQTHDDTGPLDLLVQRLELVGTVPSLVYLLRARRRVISGDLHGALSELDLALEATDVLARRLRPQVFATRGLLLVRIDPHALDEGIALCRAGRQLGLRWWRRITAADVALARLLLWRALRSDATPAQQAVRHGTVAQLATLRGARQQAVAQRVADLRAAVRLARRRCRPWHLHGPDDQLLLQEALAAREALSGSASVERRHRTWSRSVEAPWSAAARARLAAAWAEWAAGTGIPELTAEAYQHLVALVAQDSAARNSAAAKQRVLAAAQEYAEEAGYWLARTGRYREAVLALETGRAVGLTEVLVRDSARYEDITAETGDGALVYIAAAKAGGYALVVAAHHDPQFIDLPKLDRATVAALVGAIIPGAVVSSRSPQSDRGDNGRGPVRDIRPAQRAADPMGTSLSKLWTGGVRDLLLFSARGRIVTLIPVGLLSLLPLHAAGEVGTPGDPTTEGRHAGRFSAIRYAPNARGLRRCRDTARELGEQGHSLLAVDAPYGFDLETAGHLRYVTRETEEATRRWTGRSAQHAHGCTWEEFRATADDYTVWHFACHGSAEISSIMDSRLCLADRQVTLEELRHALRPGRRRLAVLSACETNLTDAAVPNEVVGLASALIQLGFAGVVAAAWKVDDLATTYLMTAFYHRWCQEGDEPAVALNRAQQWLRAATRSDLKALLPDIEPQGDPGEYPYLDPRYWAAFAYTGA